jgi:hypothetical protein
MPLGARKIAVIVRRLLAFDRGPYLVRIQPAIDGDDRLFVGEEDPVSIFPG